MKLFIITLTLLLTAYLTQSAFARAPYKVICHHNPAQSITLSFQNQQSYNGHLGTPHSLETYDTDGPCEDPTPSTTPSATPTPNDISPTPSIEPSPTQEPTPTPIVETTPTLTPTVTPTIAPREVVQISQQSNSGGSTTSTPSSCTIDDIRDVANIYVKPTGNKGELEVQWSLPLNADQVHIEYGLEQYAQHALLNTPNDGNEVIRDLVSGKHYWFRVAGVRGCGVGAYSIWYDPIVP